ncbi:MAG: hypothetical protein GXO82_09945 [Chlorobi bacterium]|nr:hypothetical protein [Chlorobiota bacterium]
MKPYLLLSIAVCILSGCAGSGRVLTDVFQVRTVAPNDPLAIPVESQSGEIIKVGDVILSERSIASTVVMDGAEGLYDLVLRLKDADNIRWKQYTRRNKGSNVAIILDGKVWSLYPVRREMAEGKLTLEGVSSDREYLDRLGQRIIQRSRQ